MSEQLPGPHVSDSDPIDAMDESALAPSRRQLLIGGAVAASAIVSIRPALANTAASVLNCTIPVPDQGRAGNYVAPNGQLVPAGTAGAFPAQGRSYTGEQVKQALRLGRLEPGESWLDCAVREVQEELCVTPLDPVRVGENRFQFVDGYSIHAVVFRAMRIEGTPAETSEGAPMWFDLDRLPYDEMWEDDSLWLPHVIAGRRFQGRFVFDGDRMLDHVVELVGV